MKIVQHKKGLGMSVQKFILIMGLCALFAGCSTGINRNLGPQTNTQMGARYLLGQGVPHDDAKALTYFEKAAKTGDASAANELGFMYAAGKGTTRNYQKSFYWYQRAANKGIASAQYNLGLLYFHGLGHAPDKTLAKHWIQKSAAAGFEPAKMTLAKLR
jgi:uncharacterized protein